MSLYRHFFYRSHLWGFALSGELPQELRSLLPNPSICKGESIVIRLGAKDPPESSPRCALALEQVKASGKERGER